MAVATKELGKNTNDDRAHTPIKVTAPKHEFFAAEGSSLSNEDARAIGPVLQRLAERGKGAASDIVEAAAAKDSPLHPYLTWNNQVAADAYRLEEARSLMASIVVKVLDNAGQPTLTRAFVNIRAGSQAYRGEGRYVPVEIARREVDMAQQVLEDAERDLEQFRAKYMTLRRVYPLIERRIGPILDAIDRTSARIEKKAS